MREGSSGREGETETVTKWWLLSTHEVRSSLVLFPFQQWQVMGPTISSCTSGMAAGARALTDRPEKMRTSSRLVDAFLDRGLWSVYTVTRLLC